MEFQEPLLPATLIRRYQRFLADVTLPDGRNITVHCPNTGAMLGCAEPGLRVWLSRASNPKRKYAHTWELVETAAGVPVGINTARANALVAEALAAGLFPSLRGYRDLRPEVRAGQGWRVDFLLDYGETQCYLEVKNVTAAVQDREALFPDAVSTRATRHLRELMAMVTAGQRAALCFCVQRDDVDHVRPFDAVDPVYGRTLREAATQGVELLACSATLTPRAIVPRRRLAVVLGGGLGVGMP